MNLSRASITSGRLASVARKFFLGGKPNPHQLAPHRRFAHRHVALISEYLNQNAERRVGAPLDQATQSLFDLSSDQALSSWRGTGAGSLVRATFSRSFRTELALTPSCSATISDDGSVSSATRILWRKSSDRAGKTVQLADFWKKGWVLLVFYRGGWCPHRNFQVRELTRALPELDKRAVTPVLISVDRVAEAAKTSATYEIPYPVLSDPELVVHRGFRVLQQVDDATLAKCRDFGIDLEGSSGQKHHTIAVPSLSLVDKEGIVRFAHADRDYKVRPSTAQILAAIDRTQGPKAPN